MNYWLLIPASIVAPIVVALICGWMSVGSGYDHVELQRMIAAISTVPSGAYGHPFDPVAELKAELPSPPPGFMWELTVDRSAEYCDVLTLGLLHVETDKVIAKTSANLTKNGLQDWRALYKRGPTGEVTDWARKVIVDQTAQWAQRQKKIHTPPEGPSHHEVIA
jgi:hypothetical protein